MGLVGPKAKIKINMKYDQWISLARTEYNTREKWVLLKGKLRPYQNMALNVVLRI